MTTETNDLNVDATSLSEAPQAVVSVVPDSVSAEDRAELDRLILRTAQEPTSERAKQELLAFKQVKGIT